MTKEEREAHLRAAERARLADPARWGEKRVSLEEALEAERTGVTQHRDRHTGQVLAARRKDVWDEFLGRGALKDNEHAAVRRLEADMAVRAGVRDADRPELGARIDVARNTEGYTQAMLEAGDRVAAVLSLVGPPSCAILQLLCQPSAAGPPAWRDVVRDITGETNPPAQAALLRFAAATLSGCYDMLDKARNRP